MQIRSFRGSGEPAWVIAPSSAGKRLGPDPRRALGPAATPAASTGRTRDRTRPMLQKRQKVLARAPSTRDPFRKSALVEQRPDMLRWLGQRPIVPIANHPNFGTSSMNGAQALFKALTDAGVTTC